MNHILRNFIQFLGFVTILQGGLAFASVSGSISGTVKDPAGSVVPGAQVHLRDGGTGIEYRAETDIRGFYILPVLPVGSYELDIEVPGFSPYQRKNITLDTNAALTFDVTLAVGGDRQTVSVSDFSLHIETISTQMGEVISGRQMTAVPLNGRSFTDLLSLQPGVAPATSITSSTVQDVGATVLNPSGDLNPGTLSVNGQRESANAFIVNGSNTEESVNMGTSIVPNLDAIEEFRVVTSNFDAEYGEFSGGQINVVTKSGTNNLHGDAFEFLRNTDLDARNYFSPTRGAFEQNQFGGTMGGPIRRDKVFFFVDYQGTRQTQGIDTGNISVPSDADRSGNLSDLAAEMTKVVTKPNCPPTLPNCQVTVPTTVSGPYLASQVLSPQLGYTVVQGEPYFFTAGESYVNGSGVSTYSHDCTSSTECVFPGATIPQSAWSVPAQRLLQYIPAPNTPTGAFATSAYNQTLRDDKGAVRADANTHWGMLSAYYFADDFNLDNPYPVAQSGASVPGFNALTTGRSQLVALGDTKTIGAEAVNEFHLSYTRDMNNLGQPVGGRGVSLVSQGFQNPDGTSSIVGLDPKGESIENINFNGYSIGAAANQLIQANNTYQIADTFSKVEGSHTMKFGSDFHFDRVSANAIAQFNGNFVFSGTETGVDFADFLIGVPSQFNQSQLDAFYPRNKYVGLFAQDSWRARPNLTLNYGLRWDRIAPWTEKYNQISTFDAGAQSQVFPGAPAGILYPGDPGVPSTLAPVDNLGFAPRVGIAWQPKATQGSVLERILGGPEATSIRASFGEFYSAIEALSISVLAGNAPYGTTYSSPAPPLFATPFITASNGQNYGQPFPYHLAPLGASRANPDAGIDWSAFEPISGIPGYDMHNRTPYTNEWMLSIERQLGPNTVLTAAYTGTASRHLRLLEEPNPGNPALCLSLNHTSEVAAGSATCGPNEESNVFVAASGQTINGTRGPLGPNFGSNGLQTNIGIANYNALELSARHSGGGLEFFASYTYSKSMDESSNNGEEVNPFNPALSYALSAFDIKHNLVFSYEYQLPFERFLRGNSLTRGWSLSGITHLASGFPVTMVNNGDNSLIGTNPNGVNNSSIDEPDYNGSSLHLSHNPRANSGAYFDTIAFSMNALGTPGNAKRRFFYGPGADNFDLALAKAVQLRESKTLLFRIEGFNAFNHAQFFGPQTVDGNIGDLGTTFGNVVSAAPPRILQAAMKFNF